MQTGNACNKSRQPSRNCRISPYGLEGWTCIPFHQRPFPVSFLKLSFPPPPPMKTTLLPRLLAGVALAGAAALPLTAGSAQAVTQICAFDNYSNPAVNCTNPNPLAKVGDKTVEVLNGPTAGKGVVDLEHIVMPPAGWLGDKFIVDIDYDPALGTAGAADVNSTFDYKIAIDPTMAPGFYFQDATLSYNDFGTASSVTKEVYSKAGYNTADRLAQLIGPSTTLLPTGFTELWIRDIMTVPVGSQLDNVTNIFTQGVPAPLPLLGAGTAFGFSRRLRRRSKARFSLG